MTNDTNDLQRALEDEKMALSRNLSELADRARDLTDWRTQVRAHPMPAIGMGIGAGVLLALLMDRRTPRVKTIADGTRAAGRHPVDGDLVFPPAHPTVDRIVNALVGVAMTKALEIIAEVVPSFTDHLADEEPSAFHLDDAPRSNGMQA